MQPELWFAGLPRAVFSKVDHPEQCYRLARRIYEKSVLLEYLAFDMNDLHGRQGMRQRASFFQMLVGTLVHKVPLGMARRCLRQIEGYDIGLSYNDLATHHLAGGRMTSLVDGLIYAREKGIEMSLQCAAARDLAAAYQSGESLTDHIKAFESIGVRNLDVAPINPKLMQKT